jgi:histone deacetylase 1/2
MSDSLLKIPKLQGSNNWDIWSIRIESILIEKGYVDLCQISEESFIASLNNENLSPKEATTRLESRRALALKALAYIRLSLADGPLLQTKGIRDPYELIQSLKNLYELRGFSSEFISCKTLINTKLSNCKGNIEVYLQEFRRIINDLESKDIKLPKNFIAALVLNNLTKEYDYIVTIITQNIRSDSIVNLDAIYSQLIDESKRLKYTNTSSSRQNIDSTKPSSNKANNDIEMSNVTKKPFSKPSNTFNKSSSKAIRCNFCSKTGHLEEKCFKKYPELSKRNAAFSTSVDTNVDAMNTTSTFNNSLDSQIALVSNKSTYSYPKEFILDSAATIHVSADRSLFNSLVPTNTSLKWGNNKANNIRASGIGDIPIRFTSTNQNAILKDVLFVPELGVNLISLALIVDKGVSLKFKKDLITLYKTNKEVLAEGHFRNKVTVFSAYSNKGTTIGLTSDISSSPRSTKEVAMPTETYYNPWHLRLGHIGPTALNALPNNVLGVNKDFSGYINEFKDCETCIKAKGTRNVNKKVSEKPSLYLEKVTIDIGGPIKPISYKGFKYYITFIDASTGYLEVILLKNRERTSLAIESFINRAETQSSYTLRRLHFDYEFDTKEFNDLALKRGIIYTTSAPYTPEQKGAGERINRTLFNKIRALLFTSKLPLKFWDEALLSAVYLYNRTPHSSYSFKTPFELRYKKKPDLSSIKTFGSLTYKKEPKETLGKLDPRANPYYLVGFIKGQYKLLDPKKSKAIYARDVYIIENKFYRDEIDESIDSKDLIIEDLDSIDPTSNVDPSRDTSTNLEDSTKPRDNVLVEELDNNLDTDLDNLDDSSTSIRAREHINNDEFYNQLLEYSVLSSSSIDSEPTTLEEIYNHPDKDLYLEAINKEVEGLNKNKTWDIVPRPKDKPVLKARYVLKKKLKANGDLDKYKARYVIKGYAQTYGINYKETFASTPKPTSLRLLLSIALLLGFFIYKGDVKQAFSIPEVDTEIYVELPPNINKDKGLVGRLNKALYGLKQAARQWQLYLNRILLDLGFTCLISDNSIYVHSKLAMYIAVYVDDILVFAKDLKDINNLFSNLEAKDLDITNLGPVIEFLGIQITYDKGKYLSLSQEGYITRLIDRYNKGKLKPLSKPYLEGLPIDPNDSTASKEDINQFQKEIGALIYLTIYTRPDLSFRVGQLARFMSNPSKNHFKALDHIWSYVNKTKTHELSLSIQSTSISTPNTARIIGYTDADYGGDLISRKSTTGYINLISIKDSTMPISWSSKLQKTVALSSCEAEYMAYKEAFKEAIYINSLLSEFPTYIRKLFSNTRTIYTDSQSAIALTKNPLYHARTKHVAISYHFIKEKIASKELELVYCPTEILLADGFTKAIPTPKWNAFTIGLNLKPCIKIKGEC